MSTNRLGAALAALGILLSGTASFAEDDRWKAGIPGSKMAVETPLKRIISSSSDSGFIEGQVPLAMRPIENYLLRPRVPSLTSISSRTPLRTDYNSASSSNKFGRTVAPGKVAWHSDFEAASAASKRSGKPVLVFQMMGKLNLEFC